jgi:hypothetical protein
MAADFLLVHSGSIGGVGDVDRHGQVWPDGESGRTGTEETDFLLHGRDRGKPRLCCLVLIHAPQSLQGHV